MVKLRDTGAGIGGDNGVLSDGLITFMREIKFRAWEPAKKEMFTDFYVNHCGGVSYWNPKVGVLQEAEGCPVMQYTGLKDSKGVEIYEADIVRSTTNPHEVYSIEFREEAGCFTMKEVPNSVWLAATHEFIKVIGNIYEDPELLK